ncbi:glucosamine--fructose-6-phosphate aminotransferase [Labrys miyagiensis]|uniref:Glucosamine--fructose-6-phosphate aminotransferase n=1 Tax=Labrys miyagiensis TaxID=346912 RepID=A0ABQ6CRV8_9HYPH|nr:SIS domain-containing protein [Labrys miyagiensis]GLS20931.1 glucosamine--fructose-6-phosphate aminotransferase [Labrys miyagiensis]
MTAPTSSSTTTAMALEIAETPAAFARFLDREGASLARIGAKLRNIAPSLVVTCARGSSDNVAGYFKYLSEICTGVPVASIGPSIASIYNAPLRLKGAVVISVSQSGKSPDILALQSAAREAGAFAIAVVNDDTSPLAAQADAVLPIHAGVEKSVAATKTCLSSAAVLAALLSEWHQEKSLQQSVRKLPGTFETAFSADWSSAIPVFEKAQSAYVIGRGPAFPVAQEAALKLKETAVLHAEAYSGAEVMHGPLQLVGEGFPILAFRPGDAAYAAMGEAIERLRAAGATMFVAGGDDLPFKSSGHPLIDPLAMLLSFYGLAEKIARHRGFDPDRPTRLHKVTETI